MKSNETNYVDEAEQFKLDPLDFLQNYYAKNKLDTHLIFYDSYLEKITPFLQKHRYQKVYLF